MTYPKCRRMEAPSPKPGSENDVHGPGRSPGRGRRAGPAGQQAARCQPRPRACGPPGLWPSPSLGPVGPAGPRPPRHRGQGCQEPCGAGGRPCCQPRSTRKMLLLSPALIWHWLPGEGGQRRPLQLGPAHREFLKDARGCGRMADVAVAGGPGPQTHHQKGGGWLGGRGRRKPASGHSVAGQGGHGERPPGPGQGTRTPWTGSVAWAPCCGRLPDRAALRGWASGRPGSLQG